MEFPINKRERTPCERKFIVFFIGRKFNCIFGNHHQSEAVELEDWRFRGRVGHIVVVVDIYAHELWNCGQSTAMVV